MGIWKAAAEALQPIFRPSGTTIAGIQPGDWNSPQQPIRPIAPPNTGVRTWDFRPGINLQFTPRGDQAVSFKMLRAVADSFDLCRLMIETRKDQIVNRPWTVRVKEAAGETKKDRLVRQAKNANIAKVTKLLQRPDGVHAFSLWMRMWLEELLVIDAPCIYPVRNVHPGDVMGLRVIAGDTITPLLDQNGFIPQPPNPAYQQIILGLPTTNLQAGGEKRDLTADQLIYSPRNPRANSRWGLSPVEQIINTLAIASRRQEFLKAYYTAGNVPEGILPMPESYTPAQIKDMQNWFDSLLSGNLQQRRRLIAIPDAKQPVQFSKEKALTDGTDDYLVRVVAFAFSISPQNLIKQVNRGTAKESSDVAQIEGLEPYLKHIETVLNLDVIQGVLGIDDVEFAYEDEREMDPLKQAQIDQIYINTGTYTRNEVRVARGDDPLHVPEGDAPGITTATGFVPLDKPEEPNDQDQQHPAGKVKKNSELAMRGGDLTAVSELKAHDMERLCAKFLESAGKTAGHQMAEAYSKFVKADDDEERRLEEILAAIEIEWEALGRSVTPLLQAAALAGVDRGRSQTAAVADYTPAKSHAWQYAHDRGAELVGMKRQPDGTFVPNPDARWAISDAYREELKSIVQQAFEEAWKPSQLAAVIEAAVPFSSDRAAMIAKTEITRAQAQGNLASWKASGVVLAVQWQTSADHYCCDACDLFEAEGEVEPGHEFAPGITAPGAHPNCNCALVVKKVRK